MNACFLYGWTYAYADAVAVDVAVVVAVDVAVVVDVDVAAFAADVAVAHHVGSLCC